MKRTTVYFPEDLRRKLAELARQTGRSQAEITRDALRAYVDRQTSPPPSFIGSGSNPDVHGADADGWLRKNWRPD
jgi:Ribbon-helix-helix protein, copG family